MAPTISIRIFGDVCILYEGQRRGDRRCAALSRNVQRPEGAGSTAGLERFVCIGDLGIDLCSKRLRFAHE